MTEVFISGTSKGIGAAMAQYLLHKGYSVTGCARTQPDFKHSSYQHLQCDLLHAQQRQMMLDKLLEQSYHPDHLILNAAIAHQGPALLTPMETYARLMELNYLSQVQLIQAFSRTMLRKQKGSITIMGSVAEGLALPLEAAYAASKAALTQYAKVLAKELANSGISVHIIAPGPVNTRLMQGVPEERTQYVLNRQVNQQWTTLDQIMATLDICMGENAMVHTGQVFYLNGI